MNKSIYIPFFFILIFLSCSEDLENFPSFNISIFIKGEGEVLQETILNVSPSNHEEIRLNAKPSENWNFIKWEGDLNTTINPIVISIDQPKNITAKFSRYFDYNKPSYYFKNSDLWLDLNKITGTNQRKR